MPSQQILGISPILAHFESKALCIFIKDNNFLGVFSIFEKNLTNFNPPK